jgi:hypothetical protein
MTMKKSIETKFIKGLFSITNRDAINYANAPLVVPPDLNRLPAPETNALVNSPAWPKDPEEVEQKKRAAAKKSATQPLGRKRTTALTPAELNVVGPKAAPAGAATPPVRGRGSRGPAHAAPNELGTKGSFLEQVCSGHLKPEVAKFEREPGAFRSDPAAARLPHAVGGASMASRRGRNRPSHSTLNKRGTGE